MTEVRGSPSGPIYPIDTSTLFATDFGADPTGTEDSTEALQAFLDATGLTGRRGRITAGTYLISSTLYTHNSADGSYFSGGIVEGDGRGVTQIKWVGDVNDGSAMMVWSRQNSVLQDLTFFGNNLASFGLVVQNAQISRISCEVRLTRQHGIAMARNWGPVSGGLNEECIIDRPNCANCGKLEEQQIRLVGSGLGGTFTLSLDGNVTAPIPYNADAATVAAALLAANPNLGGPTTAQGGSGNNPFNVSGDLTTNMFVFFQGKAVGPQSLLVIDTSGITGTITSALTGRITTGSRGDGIYFFQTGTPEGASDFGTMAIFEPQCTQCSNGIGLNTVNVKVWGGHFEGNKGFGIRMGPYSADGLSYSTANTIVGPYVEANYAGGGYAEKSVRNYIANVHGNQVFSNDADSNSIMMQPSDGSLLLVERGVSGYRLQLGADAPRILGQNQEGASAVPVWVNAAYDSFVSKVMTADEPYTIDLSVIGQNRLNYLITLDFNITAFDITGASGDLVINLKFIRGALPKTVGWPASFKWAGGIAPVLGSGAVNSVDMIVMQFHNTIWYEVSRSLAVA